MLIIGGPSYRMEVDARHAATMAEIAAYAGATRTDLAVRYRHACPVEIARNELFAEALTDDAAQTLLWLDSDCYVEEPAPLLWLVAEIARQKIPMVSVLTPQRNGDSNIWHEPTTKVRGTIKIGERKIRECAATGMGLTVFWLPWYREHWPTGPHFRTAWRAESASLPRKPGSDPAIADRMIHDFFTHPMISEDTWHGLALRSLGSSARYSTVVAVEHAHRGGRS